MRYPAPQAALDQPAAVDKPLVELIETIGGGVGGGGGGG